VKADEAVTIHAIEIYLRDWSLSSEIESVFNPIPWITLPGTRVGEFKIHKEHLRPNIMRPQGLRSEKDVADEGGDVGGGLGAAADKDDELG
jgi:hypothetical protein